MSKLSRSKSRKPTKERVLGAAARVLRSRGYAGTRLAEIAELADLQVPALYYYFDSKDDLVETVVTLGQTATTNYVNSALEALPLTTSPLDRLLAAVSAHLESVLKMSDYATAATRTIGQLPEQMQEVQADLQRAYLRFWADLFKKADEANELNPDLDLGLARMLVLGSLNWATEWWRPDRGDIETLVEVATNMVRRSIAHPRLL